MSLITDPTLLLAGNSDAATTPGAELVLDFVARTIQLVPTAGDLTLSTSGATGQALFGALKLLWRNNNSYLKIPFPMEAITPEQFEFINGWSLLNTTTKKALRTCGWAQRNTGGAVTELWAGVITLGSIGSTDQPYYQQEVSGSPINFQFTGPVNEAVQIYSDPNGDGNTVDGFDRRTVCNLFAREEQKTYASSNLPAIGVTTMTYIVYRFPLSNGTDLKAIDADAVVSVSAAYADIDVTYYGSDQLRSIGGTNYPFRTIIDGDNKTAEEIYTKIQYLLRQNSDVDAGAGSVTGKTASSLLRFVGDTLITSTGVYVDNFNPNDTNRITFTDYNAVERIFPFVATGSIVVNPNIVNDANAVYQMMFTTNPAGDYGTLNAVVVQDNLSAAIVGTVSGVTEIPFTFNYDNNAQGGRTPGTDASVTVAVIGLTTAQYVSASATITRSTGQSISLVAPLERVYQNA